MIKILLPLCCLTLISLTSLAQDTIYVDINASGNNDGSTWTDAYTDLQAGLGTAIAGDEIWVATGIYTPDSSDRTVSFQIPTEIQLYGGFSGNETDLSQRNISNNVTILSGDLNGDDGGVLRETESTRQDNSYHVVMVRGDARNIILDGFTISGGNANGILYNSCSTPAIDQFNDSRGAAININPYSYYDTIQIAVSNCTMENNTSTSISVFSYFLPCGVTYLTYDVTFDHCTVRHNYARDNGTMLFWASNGFNHYGKGLISNCLFYGNTSDSSASCVYLGCSTANGGDTLSLDFDIVNSTFSNNTGKNGLVFDMFRSANTYFHNSIVYGNGSTTPFNIDTYGSHMVNTIVEGGQQNGTNSDPLFTNSAADNFTLTSNSPAINAGDTVGISDLIPSKDLAGNTRIKSGSIDMGCYEYIPPVIGGISGTTTNSVQVYPNPASSILHFAGEMTSIDRVTVKDYTGKTVVEKTFTNALDVSSLPAGLYSITFSTKDNTPVSFHRFIKR